MNVGDLATFVVQSTRGAHWNSVGSFSLLRRQVVLHGTSFSEQGSWNIISLKQLSWSGLQLSESCVFLGHEYKRVMGRGKKKSDPEYSRQCWLWSRYPALFAKALNLQAWSLSVLFLGYYSLCVQIRNVFQNHWIWQHHLNYVWGVRPFSKSFRENLYSMFCIHIRQNL